MEVGDHDTQEQLVAALLSIARQGDGNGTCMDCGESTPKWAVVNWGILVCIRCSGHHRSLGTHVSKVKSVNMDKWTPDEVRWMARMGNANAKKVLEAKMKRSDAVAPHTGDQEVSEHLRQKYVVLKFRQPDKKPPQFKSWLKRELRKAPEDRYLSCSPSSPKQEKKGKKDKKEKKDKKARKAKKKAKKGADDDEEEEEEEDEGDVDSAAARSSDDDGGAVVASSARADADLFMMFDAPARAAQAAEPGAAPSASVGKEEKKSRGAAPGASVPSKEGEGIFGAISCDSAAADGRKTALLSLFS